jgi:hypothetical protein
MAQEFHAKMFFPSYHCLYSLDFFQIKARVIFKNLLVSEQKKYKKINKEEAAFGVA